MHPRTLRRGAPFNAFGQLGIHPFGLVLPRWGPLTLDRPARRGSRCRRLVVACFSPCTCRLRVRRHAAGRCRVAETVAPSRPRRLIGTASPRQGTTGCSLQAPYAAQVSPWLAPLTESKLPLSGAPSRLQEGSATAPLMFSVTDSQDWCAWRVAGDPAIARLLTSRIRTRLARPNRALAPFPG